MNQLLRFGLILGSICLAATLVLAVTYEVTKPKIDAQMKKEEDAALRTVLPLADTFAEKDIAGIDYFEGSKDGRIEGYCVRVIANGYGGFIRLIVGIDGRGVITGISVLEHQETPGLGSKINEIKPGDNEPWFLAQFRGKDAGAVFVKKNIDAITGATISSRAVTDAVRESVAKFRAEIDK